MKLSKSRRDTFFLSAMLIFSAIFYLFFAFLEAALSLPRQRDLYRHEPAPGTALLPLSGSYARAFRPRPRKISDGRHHHPEPSYCSCRLVDSRIFIQKALPPQTGRLSSAHDAFWGVLIVPLRCGKTRYVLHQH